MSRAITDNTNSFNHIWNNFILTTADDESKILAWLSPLEPQVRHRDIRNQRVARVGDWLLETKEFRSWYDGSEQGESYHAALFCYGDAGVGKSYISSVVVDYLCDRAMEQDTAVACFYYYFASREVQSPTNMVGSLLKQLLSGLESIPGEIIRKFRSERKVIGGRELQLPDIINMFPSVSTLQRIFICVDALDECVPKHLLEVLEALRQILQRSPNARMFIAGRSHIRGQVERELGRLASVSIKPRDDDIVTYLRGRLRKDTTPEVMDSGLENDILKSIPKEVSETFLLASLKVEAILRETTIHRRRERLNAMEDGLGLGNAYAATMDRIRAQDKEKAELAVTTLMWVCYSERPLRVDELCHALAVQVGSAEFNTDNIPATDTLLTCCQGLITVDKEASTVRLIHHTVREYLTTHCNIFHQAHAAIAETCLTYLSSCQTQIHSAMPRPTLLSMPFLKYCSRYWGAHANRELSDHLILLAMGLLNQHENHIAAESLLGQVMGPCDSPEVDALSLFSGLHCASFFGIVEVMTALLEMKGCDINQRDYAGMTPLIWAARNGHVEAVKLLLAQEAVDPDIPDNCGYSPLHWAAVGGHEPVVKQFLDRKDVNPNKPSNEGHTPLSGAAFNGHGSVVKQLLDREDVNPDVSDNKGHTPLGWAARNGHGSVVKDLLDRKDVNPNKPDNNGYTPLSRAAFNGRDSVVKQLLDRKDIKPDKPDNMGHTPLHCAARNGYESVVKQLLDRKDVDPHKLDNKGRTPFSWAKIGGHEPVVKQFLNRGDANPDRSGGVFIGYLGVRWSNEF